MTGVVEELLVEVCGRAAEAFEASTSRLGPGDLHQLRQDPRPGAHECAKKKRCLRHLALSPGLYPSGLKRSKATRVRVKNQRQEYSEIMSAFRREELSGRQCRKMDVESTLINHVAFTELIII